MDAIENGQLLFLRINGSSSLHKDFQRSYSLEELEQGFRQLIQQAEFYPKALESQKEVLKLAEREEILAFFTRMEGEKDDDLHL
ncbi:MAG: hypothetical protein ACLUSV_06455 [Streptococcus sp.]